MEPLVSVIMPAYNAERTIAGALSSALNQTHRNLEVIVVDDESTDATATIASAFGDRVRVISQPNAGCGSARNTAIRAARGDHLAWLDSDDLWLPRHVELALAMLRPGDKAMVTSDAYTIGPDGIGWQRVLPEGAVAPERLRSMILRRNPVSIFGLYPRAMLEDLGEIDGTLRRCEDWQYWARAVFRGWEIRFQTTPTALYRLLPTSLSADTAKMLDAEDQMMERLEHYVGDALTPAERAHLAERRALGSWQRHVVAAREALAAGDAATSAEHFGLAARLDPDDARSRRNARILGLPGVGRALAARRRHAAAPARTPVADDRRVSVVMPAHNAAATVGAALTGALTQTHPNVEIVVVDDGSDDATATIAAAHGERVVLVRQDRAGVSAARNAGLAAATGSHVVLCDADDVLLPHHVARALATLDAAPPRSWVASQALVLDEQGIRRDRVLGFSPLPRDAQRRAVLERNIIPIHTLVPRPMVAEIGPMDEELERCEDWQYWIRAIIAGWRVAFQMEPTALHRSTPGSLSSSQEGMWADEGRMVAALPGLLGAGLTADEHAYLAARIAAGSPDRLHTRGDAALAAGDLRTGRRLLGTAGRLDRSDLRARTKARLTRVPLAARLLVAFRRRRPAARPVPHSHQEGA